MPVTTSAPPKSPTGPASLDAIFQKLFADTQDGVNKLLYHETGGAFISIWLAVILTIWVWWKYGPTAGAPLAASTFICLAMLL